MKITGLEKEANTYILRRFDAVMVVDPASNYEVIAQKIKGMKLLGILLTHAHASHLNLIGYFNCPIYLHKDDYILFTSDELNGNNLKNKKEYDYKNIDLKLIDSNTILKIVDQEVVVIHTPGHTKGSVCYYYDNKLYTGDTLTVKGAGFSKRKPHSDYQLKKSVKLLYEKFSVNTVVCPGHGEDTTLLEIRQNNSKVRTILKNK